MAASALARSGASSNWITWSGPIASRAAEASISARSAATTRSGSPRPLASSSAASSASRSTAITSMPDRARCMATRPEPAPSSTTGPPASAASSAHNGRSAA